MLWTRWARVGCARLVRSGDEDDDDHDHDGGDDDGGDGGDRENAHFDAFHMTLL